MKTHVAIGIRNRTLLTAWGVLESYRRPMPGTSCMIREALDTAVGFADTLTYEISDRKEVRKNLEMELRAGRYTQAFFDALDASYKRIVQDIKTFWRDDLSKRSNVELVGHYDRFLEIYLTTLHPMVLAIYASDLQDLFDRNLETIIPGITPEQRLQYTALLLTPTRLTQVQKEEQLLYDLQKRFENSRASRNEKAYIEYLDSEESRAALRDLEERCGWFHMEYIGKPRTAAEYHDTVLQRLRDVGEGRFNWADVKSPQERMRGIIAEQQAFFDRKPDVFFKELVFAMQEFIIVLDYTKADLVEGIWYARPLLSELARRVGVASWIEVRYLLPHELRGLLASREVMQPGFTDVRKKRFALWLKDDKITYYFGEDARAITEELVQKDEANGAKEFKGMVAYPGVVRGIATVITSAADRGKFVPGRILVTRETTTELTSVIKGSIAIVADQGGLLSHTAIVSREFKIPCIVQARIATQAVRDGDEIEVDASAGIVRILSR